MGGREVVVDVEVLADGLDVPEGPIVDDDGSVLFVQIRSGLLSRVGRDGVVRTVADCGGGPNGAAWAPDGTVLVCNNGGAEWQHLGGALYLPTVHGPASPTGCIQRVDPATGRVDILYDRCEDRPLVAPNDLVVDDRGGFWFTDFGRVHAETITRGSVYYAAVDGSAITRVISGLDRPNGCALSPDGRRLVVSETATGRLWSWAVTAPGTVTVGERTYRGSGGGDLLYAAPGNDRFDSMAMEAGGNVCVATYFDRGVSVVSPEGELLELVVVPGDPLLTNLCFGGPDQRTAYITSPGRGALYACRWPRPGLVASRSQPSKCA